MCDAHVHFFSPGFFDTLGAQKGLPADGRVGVVAGALGWDEPRSVAALADHWVGELDRHGVARAALIASVPADEAAVAAAVNAHPGRFIGFYMLDPMKEDALDRVAWAAAHGLRGICLFPAMHRYAIHGPEVARVCEMAAATPGTAVFVHCGLLSVGARTKLGLPSRFEMRFGNPLDLQGPALAHPRLPFIVPHFGAGLLREALMLADVCPNVYFDTSSSNRWLRYTPHLTLRDAFRASLDVMGSQRLLFGTDSSFFPRGWQPAILEAQRRALADTGATDTQIADVVGANFDRLFPLV
ncbi:MAG: amidohydrolase family protein [Acidobacteria bacterium]|nr:amidohydrolase family protein [Acidobacteriota bacterium]